MSTSSHVLVTCLVTLTKYLTHITYGQAYFGSQPILGKLWDQEIDAAPSVGRQRGMNVCAGLAFSFLIQFEPQLKVWPTFRVGFNLPNLEDFSP